MRKWFLLAVLGIVLLYAFSLREGVDSTLAPTPKCQTSGDVLDVYGWCHKPNVTPTPAKCPAGTTLTEETSLGGFPQKICYAPPGMTRAAADNAKLLFNSTKNRYYVEVFDKCPTGYGLAGGTGIANMCQADNFTRPTCSSGYEYDVSTKTCKSTTASTTASVMASPTDACTKYWDAAIVSWASGAAASPATATAQCERYAPSWVSSSITAGRLLDASGNPTAATKAQAIIEKKEAADYATETATTKAYASSTGYAGLAANAQDADSGPLPPAINATSHPMDTEVSRPSVGTVFGDNGPFSGEAGTGQGSGINAAATLTGSTYAHPPPTEARLDPYDFWPGTKGASGGTFLSAGASLPVQGPDWGGPGKATTAAASKASQPGPTLYGPAGTKLTQNNSANTSMLPSFGSAGSDWLNQYAATSREPGDQDPFASAFSQSSAYSLANGSQKTDPVPYLTDFSTFQK